MTKPTKRQLVELLRNLVDYEECRTDHHGYCQTHRLEENCSVAEAREALEHYPA